MKPVARKKRPFGLKMVMDLFDVGPVIAVSTLAFAAIVMALTVFYFVRSAPPSTLTIAAGPEGSIFQKTALKYAKALEQKGIRVKVQVSEGSIQNLKLLADPSSHVDVGIAQAGLAVASTENLVSLGSISYQPLLVFYRGHPLELLSGLEGKRVSVGPQGSGTRDFALKLLTANGIRENGSTSFLDWEAEKAAQGLLDGKIDAAFIMSENASGEILHKLLHSVDVHLMSFKQANAYSRKIDYLNVMDLPEGAVDLALDIPQHDVTLLGPMVELVAVKGLHPALSDLLLEAATEVHNRPGLFQHRGEFPAPVEHAIHISEDAARFYKSGKSLLYRYLPFWLASLTSRIMFVILPALVFLIPAVKSIPAFFQWRMRTKIRRHYRELLKLEQDWVGEKDRSRRDEMRDRFERIEHAVNQMKISAAFADQYYGLRGHIDFVHQLLVKRHS